MVPEDMSKNTCWLNCYASQDSKINTSALQSVPLCFYCKQILPKIYKITFKNALSDQDVRFDDNDTQVNGEV